MKLNWLKNIIITQEDNNYAVPELLVILPENEHESRLLEAFVTWRRHSQNLSKKEES